MAEIGRGDQYILGQVRPAVGGTSEELYAASGVEAKITGITMANTTGAAAKATVYMAADGVTFDQSTALFYQINLQANETIVDPTERGLPMSAVMHAESDTNVAITFTLHGKEEVL